MSLAVSVANVMAYLVLTLILYLNLKYSGRLMVYLSR
ncbi:uncharacterized protein METZ01_LOCUS153015 [marine metagenome]|uniref:Uncharacterized protein n=1 Tax=marine metagenome TaxID=408172 RepID=A0A382AFV0_9ZZZZ